MRGVAFAGWLVVASGLAAGCLDEQTEAPPAVEGVDLDAIAAAIGTPIVVDHDHNEVAEHTGSLNLEFVAWSSFGMPLGERGFANFVFYEDDDEDLVFIASDGDARAGFIIADVSDPRNIQKLGEYEVVGNNVQEVRVFPGGRYALMNIQATPILPDQAVDGPQGGDCTVCIQVIDVQDRANPTFESELPVDLLGSHNMDIVEMDGTVYVFYVGQPLTNDPAGNYVGIAQLVETPAGATLVKVSEFRHDALQDPGRSFPHDIIVRQHPLTDQWIAWVSHWDGGAITFDVTDPLRPQELDIVADAAPSDVLSIHWYAPEAGARMDGRVIAWSAPEIGNLDTGSGIVRAYDASDPADVKQIGTWDLPGDVTIPDAYVLSPHIVQDDMPRGLAAVSHYHAGVWILDITDPAQPRHVAYYTPHGDPAAPYEGPLWWKKPNFNPDGYFPNVYQARWHDDLLWVSERGSGLYVLEYTGPVPGPV